MKQKVSALLALILLLSGCTGASSAPETLRLAVLPILDVLPLYVAQSEGYFAQQGVTVELVPVASAAERDQLLQAGQVDGVITDLVALALYNRQHLDVVGVRTAMRPTAQFAQFRVLAAPQSAIHTAAELADVPVAVSEGTIIEYVTEQLLRLEGVPPEHVAKIAVPKIPDRMALLASGGVQAATLPEPLASLAMQKGGRVLVDDSRHPEVSCSVFAFRQATLTAHPQAVRKLLLAVEQAVQAINADKSRWDDLLVEKKLLPPTLQGSFTLPDYPTAGLPAPEQYAAVGQWLQSTGRLTAAPDPAALRADWLPAEK